MLRNLSIRSSLMVMSILSIVSLCLIAGLGSYEIFIAAQRLETQVHVTSAIRHQMAIDMVHCQSACKTDPLSASKIDPLCCVEIRA